MHQDIHTQCICVAAWNVLSHKKVKHNSDFWLFTIVRLECRTIFAVVLDGHDLNVEKQLVWNTNDFSTVFMASLLLMESWLTTIIFNSLERPNLTNAMANGLKAITSYCHSMTTWEWDKPYLWYRNAPLMSFSSGFAFAYFSSSMPSNLPNLKYCFECKTS